MGSNAQTVLGAEIQDSLGLGPALGPRKSWLLGCLVSQRLGGEGTFRGDVCPAPPRLKKELNLRLPGIMCKPLGLVDKRTYI